jgi:hypothetical protein
MRAHRRDWLIGSVFALSLAGPAVAAGSVSSLLACRDIADSVQRLACFDREADALAPVRAPAPAATAPAPAAAVTAAPAPSSPTASVAVEKPVPVPTPAPAPAPAPQQFGLSQRAVEEQEVAAGARAARISKIDAHLVRTARTSDGHMTFTLDNDQVWRQVEAEDMLVQPGEALTISRAALGSYWLKMSSGRGCKVTRVR